MRVSDKKFKISFIIISLLVLLATILVSLKLGSVNITFKELISGLFSGQSDGNIGIIKDLRMPRNLIFYRQNDDVFHRKLAVFLVGARADLE